MRAGVLLPDEKEMLLVEHREALDFLTEINYQRDGTIDPVGTKLQEHLLRVGRNARLIGQLVWDENPVKSDLLFAGGLLHDIGKSDIGINTPRLLSHEKEFDTEDRARMRLHTVYGYGALRSLDSPLSDFAAVAAALHHDFKPGSTGFNRMPFGIEKTIDSVKDAFDLSIAEIMQLVLTVSVCDVVDAIEIEKRQYVDDGLRPASFDPKTMTSWVRSFISVDAAEKFGIHQGDLSAITTNLAWMLSSDS